MAEAPKVTIGFDNETKSLIRELIDAVKRLDDGVDLDQSFGDSRRLIEVNETPSSQFFYPEDNT